MPEASTPPADLGTPVGGGASAGAPPFAARSRILHFSSWPIAVKLSVVLLASSIVPMSIIGSYQFFQTGNWMIYPGKITVILHDTIETANIPRGKIDELRQQVQEIVSAPVEESLKAFPVEH